MQKPPGVFDLKHTQPPLTCHLSWAVFRVVREGKLLPSLVEDANEKENLPIGKVS